MTMIAEYYARVGVDVDRGSLTKVDAHLKGVERRVSKFQRRMARGGGGLGLNLTVRKQDLLRNIRTSMRGINSGKGLAIQFGKVNFKQQELVNGLNRSLKQASLSGQGVKLQASLSKKSLQAIRGQLTQLMRSIHLTPNVRLGGVTGAAGRSGGGRGIGVQVGGGARAKDPYPHNVSRTDPTSRRVMSPYYNPMMLGGAAGALMRFGAHGLPLYGGVLGANALMNKASSQQNQRNQIATTISAYGGTGDAQGYMKALDELGDKLAYSRDALLPNFNKYLGAAIGTPLEKSVETSFAEVIKLTSSMGLNARDSEDTLFSLLNMFLNQERNSSLLRGQKVEKLPPVVTMMAEAVSGGDYQELFDMMKEGQLNIDRDLPKLLSIMNKSSTENMHVRFESLDYQRDRLGKAAETLFDNLMKGGGERNITDLVASFARLVEKMGGSGGDLSDLFMSITGGASLAVIGLGDFAEFLKEGKWSEGSIGDLIGKRIASFFEDDVTNEILENLGFKPKKKTAGGEGDEVGGGSWWKNFHTEVGQRQEIVSREFGSTVKETLLSLTEMFKTIREGTASDVGKKSLDLWASAEAVKAVNRQMRVTGKELTDDQKEIAVTQTRQKLLNTAEKERADYIEKHGSDAGFYASQGGRWIKPVLGGGVWDTAGASLFGPLAHKYGFGSSTPTAHSMSKADRGLWNPDGTFAGSSEKDLPRDSWLWTDEDSPLYLGTKGEDTLLQKLDREVNGASEVNAKTIASSLWESMVSAVARGSVVLGDDGRSGISGTEYGKSILDKYSSGGFPDNSLESMNKFGEGNSFIVYNILTNTSNVEVADLEEFSRITEESFERMQVEVYSGTVSELDKFRSLIN